MLYNYKYKKYKDNLTDYPKVLTGITALEYGHDVNVMAIENCELLLENKELLTEEEINNYNKDLELYKSRLEEIDKRIETLNKLNK